MSTVWQRDVAYMSVSIFYGVGAILVFTLQEKVREYSCVYGEFLQAADCLCMQDAVWQVVSLDHTIILCKCLCRSLFGI